MHELRILIWFGFFFLIIYLFLFIFQGININFQKKHPQESIANLKDSDDISKFTDILQKIVILPARSKKSMKEIVEDFQGDFPTVLDLRSFTKTKDWNKWTEKRNIPPGIIGPIEDIFKKTEELEKEQKRKQEELGKLGSHSKVRVYGSDFGKYYIFKMFKDFSYKIKIK